MRVLLLYAHPVETSFAAALRDAARERLARAGHAVDLCDLYAEGFDPVMPRAERLAYHDLAANRVPVAEHVRRLEAADALVIISPIWNFGHPAILKGYLDRVFLPGVTFRLEAGRVRPALRLKRLAAVHTYGADQLRAWLAGDPPRRIVSRVLASQLGSGGRSRYLALYGMNRATAATRAAFLRRVGDALEKL